jgi:serine/threonine protein phosphatase 1
MRILVIGDIHGYSTVFDSLIAAVNLQPEDKLIALGDYIDRGPDSKGVIERLIALHDTGQLVALRGNHEQTMLDLRFISNRELQWICDDGNKTLSYSISGNDRNLVEIPDSHWNFLENVCVNWHETDKHFFVHANAESDLPLSEQPENTLLWKCFDNPAPHVSGKIMVCGHTSQKSGVPLNLGHAICIDTWVYGKGWLTCLDVMSGRIWQANQAGAQRMGCVDRPN